MIAGMSHPDPERRGLLQVLFLPTYAITWIALVASMMGMGGWPFPYSLPSFLSIFELLARLGDVIHSPLKLDSIDLTIPSTNSTLLICGMFSLAMTLLYLRTYASHLASANALQGFGKRVLSMAVFVLSVQIAFVGILNRGFVYATGPYEGFRFFGVWLGAYAYAVIPMLLCLVIMVLFARTTVLSDGAYPDSEEQAPPGRSIRTVLMCFTVFAFSIQLAESLVYGNVWGDGAVLRGAKLGALVSAWVFYLWMCRWLSRLGESH